MKIGRLRERLPMFAVALDFSANMVKYGGKSVELCDALYKNKSVMHRLIGLPRTPR